HFRWHTTCGWGMLMWPERTPSRRERRGRATHLSRVPIMKKILAALVVSLAIPAGACRADDHCCSFGHCGTIHYGFRVKICASGCFKWKPCTGPCCGCANGGGFGSAAGGYGAAPWYSTWPSDAGAPTPTAYPYWPSGTAPATMMQPPQQYGYNPGDAMPGPYQTAGYLPNVPSYWYGN